MTVPSPAVGESMRPRRSRDSGVTDLRLIVRHMTRTRRSMIMAVALASFGMIPASLLFGAWMSGSLPFHTVAPVAVVGVVTTITWWLAKAKLVLAVAAIRSGY